MVAIAKTCFPALRHFGVALLAFVLHGANAQALGLASDPSALAKAALGSQPGAAAVGVWREGRASYGYARNDGAGRPAGGEESIAVLFEIGSVSKVFTGLLLAQAPAYLRGSMNNWGIQSRFVADGAGQYSASLVLAPGRHEFKLGSEDWSTIDFGGAGGSTALALGSATTLHEAGSNLIIEVPRQASYKFTLNITHLRAPVLTVTAD